MRNLLSSAILSVLLLFMFPNYLLAASGCCSWHGGVCGCSSGGRQVCCDGSLSPSCTCAAPAPAPVKRVPTPTSQVAKQVPILEKEEICAPLVEEETKKIRNSLETSEEKLAEKEKEYRNADDGMFINGIYAFLFFLLALCFYNIGKKSHEVSENSSWKIVTTLFVILIIFIFFTWM